MFVNHYKSIGYKSRKKCNGVKQGGKRTKANGPQNAVKSAKNGIHACVCHYFFVLLQPICSVRLRAWLICASMDASIDASIEYIHGQ